MGGDDDAWLWLWLWLWHGWVIEFGCRHLQGCGNGEGAVKHQHAGGKGTSALLLMPRFVSTFVGYLGA
jgi:hypothetical protein